MKTRLILTVLLALYGILFAQSPPCAADLIQQWKEQADSTFRLQHKPHSHHVSQYRTHLLQSSQFWQHYYDASTPGDHISSGSQCRKARYIIPIIVHVIHDPLHSTPGTGSNISDAQIENQIEALNDAFANSYGGQYSVNSDIQFCLDRGLGRYGKLFCTFE